METRIKLTEVHKSKLLEMANKLFPEDAFTFDNDYGEDGIIDRNFCALKNENSKKLNWEDKGSHFHWFEFCIFEIVDELAWNSVKGDILAEEEFEQYRMQYITEIFRGKYINERFHVVDWLYEEFKQSQNEN